jgi:hypothetical protein
MKSKNEIANGIWNSAKVITEAKAFFNHYESNGWMVGKNKMKNWEAAIRNWMNNNSKFETQKQNTNGKPKFDNTAHYQNVAAQVAANISAEREG